ncbi:fido domain-containing protein [Mycena metata]|uniref:Fido domain-containing protein n=1 Tax=Mycena metata TaxID=1033252 RepID=A0AAD7P1S7_9AGAR|nr:fido domain-containing protein [Mycena metata]
MPFTRRAVPSTAHVRRFLATLPADPLSQVQIESKLRRSKLKEIYKVFGTMTKGTPEYTELANSGRVWEEFARPGNTTEFLRVQDELKDGLKDLDELREAAMRKMSLSSMALTLVAAVAHQSVAFEDNPLTLGDAGVVRDRLLDEIDMSHNGPLPNPLHMLGSLPLPPPEELLPNKDPSAVAELRNQLFLSQYLAENATRIASSPVTQPDLRDIQTMSSVLLRGTTAEKLYASGWGPILPLGAFRGVPIQVRSHPLAIFPYPDEVPALMERLLLWRQETHAQAVLHPLIFAARYETYFTAVHPFLDGNGRAGRLLAGFYLVQNGFLPTAYPNLDREGYLHAVRAVHEGRPDSLCWSMLEAQRETMSSFLRETNGP